METFSSVFRTSHERTDVMGKEAGYKERKVAGTPWGGFVVGQLKLLYSRPSCSETPLGVFRK